MENQRICPTCKKVTSFTENPWVSRLINNKLSDENYFDDIPRQNFSQWFFNSPNNYSSTNDDTGALKVIILTLEDRKINVYVEKSDTIKILKFKIQQKDGILFYFL
jgi:hypothetical protein